MLDDIKFILGKLKKINNNGVAAILLALFLPLLIASVYFGVNLTDKSSEYTQKNCSAEIVLGAIKNYNFGTSFENQKLNLLSYADAIYNDWTIKTGVKPIDLENDTITFNKFYIKADNTDYNQFIALYYIVDGCYRNGYFYNNNSPIQYITNRFKILDVAIPNDKLSQYSYAYLPIDNDNLIPYNEHIDGQSQKSIKFSVTKIPNETNLSVIYTKRKSNSDILTLIKDPKADKLTAKITWPNSGEIYESSAVPAKCNLDIILCIPTNGASCNALNLDAASISEGKPLTTSSTAILPENTTSTPIYQISQACKKFLAENFLSTQGLCVGIIPYSGKISIPHYCACKGLSVDPYVFNLTYCADIDYNNLINKAYGHELYSLCGDSNLRLDAYSYGSADKTECSLYNPYIKGHKYGFPIMYQRGSMKNDGKGFYSHSTSIDISKIISSEGNSNDASFMLANMYPPYLGYTNFLSLKAEGGIPEYPTNIEYQPNPYYILMLTPDIIKACDLLECFRPINDNHNVSNFCFLPFFFSNYLLNYSATGDNTRNTSADYFSQESKLSSERNKAVILFINKPDHFEPGELTYLGFSNDNNQFYFGESDAIKFNVDYGSQSYKFLDGTLLKSVATTTSGNVDLYGTKKILRFIQTGGTLSKTETAEYSYWKAPEGQITKASLKFPAKHLIKLVFEGNYIKARPSAPAITFYSENGVSECKEAESENKIPLDTPYALTKETEFIFSGSNLASITSSGAFNGLIYYGGKNFRANMSPYKVKYNLVNGEITSATLKDQVLRFNWSGINRCDDENILSSLILNNGRKINKPLDLTNLGYSVVDSIYVTENILNNMNLFNDVCCNTTIQTTASIKISNNAQDNHWLLTSDNTLLLKAYGIETGNWYASIYSGYTSKVLSVGVETSSGYYDPNLSYYWNWLHVLTSTINSAYTKYTNLKISGMSGKGETPLYAIYLKNSKNKTLSSTSQVTSSSILDEHMSQNLYIDLYKLSSPINNIPAGDWICFQGDGELHVKITPLPVLVSSGLYISNLKNTTNVTINDIGSKTFPNRKIVYIEPSSISDSVDSDGNYHLDLEMEDVTLVSAEITNRTHTKVEPTANYSLESTVEEDTKETVTETENEIITRRKTGDKVRTYKITTNDRRPIKISVTPSETIQESIQNKQKFTVTFYSENGVSECKEAESENKIPLDTPYALTKETEFIFSGSNLSSITSSGVFNGLIYYGGKNFRTNVSPYKVKYNLVNSEISSVNLKDQVLRFNWSGINRCKDENMLSNFILNNGKKISKPLDLTNLGYNAADSLSITENIIKDLSLFNDICCETKSSTATAPIKISKSAPDNHWIFTADSYNLYMTAYGIGTGIWYASIYCGFNGVKVIDIGTQKIKTSLFITPGYYSPNLTYVNEWLSVLTSSIPYVSTSYTNLRVLGKGYENTALYAIYLKNANNKTLSSTSTITSSTTLDEHMSKNSYVDLYKLSSPLNDISAGDWICFQGDGELHVKVCPKLSAAPATSTSSYWSTYASYELKNLYITNDRNFPYEFYNQSNGKKNYNAIENASSSNVQYFTLDPHRAVHTRDKDGNYVYTITVKNAVISDVEVVGKEEKSFIFPDQGVPQNNQPINLYKSRSYDSSLASIFSSQYFIERLYPYISYGTNSTYSIASAYGNIYTKKYHADGTAFLNGFTEWPNFTSAYSNYIPDYSGNKNTTMYIPSFTRIFSPLRRSTANLYRKFSFDNSENGSKLPYKGWAEICGIHYTMPDNYALSKYLENYPEDTPSDKYDQEAILQKVALRCANNLKKSGNVKIYIIKYRKQTQYKTIEFYSGGGVSINWNYDYLDSCASGNDYIYDCNSEDELNEAMQKIAKRIKNEANYDEAYCI